MTAGRVENLQAFLPVTLRLRGRGDLTIECVLDTGFVGFLSLPAEAVSVLGLSFLYDTAANLADDSTIRLPVHEGIAVWNGYFTKP